MAKTDMAGKHEKAKDEGRKNQDLDRVLHKRVVSLPPNNEPRRAYDAARTRGHQSVSR